MTVRYYRSPKTRTGTDETSFASASLTTFTRRHVHLVGNAADVPPGAAVEDLDRSTVLPSLIDAHTPSDIIAMTTDAVGCTSHSCTRSRR